MELQCPYCGRDYLREIKIDRYSNTLYRRLACCDCGCELVAKYCLAGTVVGSVRAGETPLSLEREASVGAQMVRQMFASVERAMR